MKNIKPYFWVLVRKDNNSTSAVTYFGISFALVFTTRSEARKVYKMLPAPNEFKIIKVKLVSYEH